MLPAASGLQQLQLWLVGLSWAKLLNLSCFWIKESVVDGLRKNSEQSGYSGNYMYDNLKQFLTSSQHIRTKLDTPWNWDILQAPDVVAPLFGSHHKTVLKENCQRRKIKKGPVWWFSWGIQLPVYIVFTCLLFESLEGK